MTAASGSRIVAAFVLLPIGLLTACRKTENVAGPVRIVAGSTTDLVYLPATLAHRLGYYAGEGVDVTITDTAAGSKSLEALLGGSADVVTGFYDHTIQMAAEGRGIKAFVEITRYPGAVAVVSPEGAKKIRKIEDLRHKNVGVTAPGSSSHFFLNYLLTIHRVPPTDVSVIGIGGGASRVSAIERSKVDAGVLFEPGVTQLIHRAPGAVILADTRTPAGVQSIFGVDTYPAAVFYASDTWLDKHADQAQRIARAMVRTLAWIQGHSAEEIAARMPEEFKGGDPGVYIEALRNSKQMYSPDGRLDPAATEAVRKVLAVSSEKVRNARIDLSKTFTNAFVEPRR